MEAEKTIKKTIQIRKAYYKENKVHPFHLFLAASQIKETLLLSILRPKKEIFERLEKYYIKLGVITQPITKTSVWTKLFK